MPEINPYRPCCGQQHHGPVCPDGLVMCVLCFKRVSPDRLHVLEEGDGAEASSAPIHEEARWTSHHPRNDETTEERA